MKKYFHKTILLAIVTSLISVSLFFVPPRQPANAIFFSIVHDPIHTVTNIANGVGIFSNGIMYFVKEYVIKPLVRLTANKIQNKILNKVYDVIGGLNGQGPQFITNWRSEVLSSLARSNDIFRTTLANTQFCDYFDKELKQAFGADKYSAATDRCVTSCLSQKEASDCKQLRPEKCNDPTIATSDRECFDFKNVNPAFDLCMAGIEQQCKNSCSTQFSQKNAVAGSTPFSVSARCSLGANFNPQVFAKDFEKGGGWQAWTKLFAGQNDLGGALLASLGELSAETERTLLAEQTERLTGSGYKANRTVQSKTGPSKTGTDDLCVSQCIGQASAKNTTECQKKVTQDGCFDNQTSDTCNAQIRQCVDARNDFARVECSNQCQQNLKSACGPNETIFGRCLFQSDILTPADLFGKTSAKAIDTHLERFGLGATEVTDVLVGLLDSVLNGVANKLVDLGGKDRLDTDGATFQQGSGDIKVDPKNPDQGYGVETPPTPVPTPTPVAKLGSTCDVDADKCPTDLFCSAFGGVGLCIQCERDSDCAPVSDATGATVRRTCDKDNNVCLRPGGNEIGEYCFQGNQCKPGLICGKNSTCKERGAKDTSTTPTPTPTTGGPTPTPTTSTSPSGITITGSPAALTIKPSDPFGSDDTIAFKVTGAPANAAGKLELKKTSGGTPTTENITANASGAVPEDDLIFTFDETDAGEWQAIATFGSLVTNIFKFTIRVQ